MSLPRSLILSVMLAFGYSATACSQDQNDAQTESEAPAVLDNDAAVEVVIPAIDVAAAKANAEKLAGVIQRLDEDAVVNGNSVVFKIAERELMMVYDSNANRMRVISPIIPIAALPEGVMERMLQANYDAVLDARYALANDLVWSIFIHPLASLTEDDFISALAQTVTAAETFGTTYTSGAVVFGGGDTSGIHEGLLEELQEAQKSRSDI